LAVYERAVECLKKVFGSCSCPLIRSIEQASAKLKVHVRKAEARSVDALRRVIGDICNLFKPTDCWNYLKAAGSASV
jgi:hypothetical protein